MDTDETLRRLRAALEEYHNGSDDKQLLYEIADRFEVLDDQLSKGRPLPKAWQR